MKLEDQIIEKTRAKIESLKKEKEDERERDERISHDISK